MDLINVSNETKSSLEQSIRNVLNLVIQETNKKDSLWEIKQLKMVMKEFESKLTDLVKNQVRYEYGKKQRMLVSTYFITDSLKPLASTELGKKVLEFQEKIDSM